MGELFRAIAAGDEPANSGADHLMTLRLVEAAYRASEEHRAVDPREIPVAGEAM
jgi:predicted dehydrogenase